jgi:hypothetical protein
MTNIGDADKAFVDEMIEEEGLGVSKLQERETDMKQEAKETEITNTPWTSIDMYYRGFHCKKSVPDTFTPVELKAEIDKYADQGFLPSWNQTTNEAVAEKKETITKPEVKAVPLCGIHGTPMIWKEGTYKDGVYTFGPKKGQSRVGDTYAFWSCSERNADGSYCKYKPPKA